MCVCIYVYICIYVYRNSALMLSLVRLILHGYCFLKNVCCLPFLVRENLCFLRAILHVLETHFCEVVLSKGVYGVV